jgi:hypothetical protein
MAKFGEAIASGQCLRTGYAAWEIHLVMKPTVPGPTSNNVGSHSMLYSVCQTILSSVFEFQNSLENFATEYFAISFLIRA